MTKSRTFPETGYLTVGGLIEKEGERPLYDDNVDDIQIYPVKGRKFPFCRIFRMLLCLLRRSAFHGGAICGVVRHVSDRDRDSHSKEDEEHELHEELEEEFHRRKGARRSTSQRITRRIRVHFIK